MTETTSKPEPQIKIRGLYKIFGADPERVLPEVQQGMSKSEVLETTQHVVGLRAIDIDMYPGKTTVIMGLSGSGKSTLIRHLNRLIEPTTGEILVDGQDVMKMNPAELRELRRTRMSMVFQKFALLPHRSVLDNAAMPLEVREVPEEERHAEAQKWLARVGLDGYGASYPHQLSGGMQQRVGIARALTSNSDIMLMDEAFSALDPLIRTDMQNLLLELQEELHKTIVFITHDLDEALKLADHLVILKDGEIVQQGEPQRILMHPEDPYIVDFISDINRARVLRARTVMTEGITPDAVVHGDVDVNDTLESVIARAEGRTDQAFRVVRDGQPVGHLSMTDVVLALVPTDASEQRQATV
ncbi:quaternary amine ABC transporter ATP-binding protein [Pseudooceanicola nitratireducens]|uniref:quaternary amine ABC transporter ATP-binding protein n=1 Tax=Pseudooceanicola nitratireducens TaxID=517719 RepID=UPI0023F42DDB|nr:betaine/proline/choline family ABC transporter ATP-binding protein [Pseudooceanicola nitratireducens]MEC7298555.1 betaine/proline/choline family ABC transporter ATP-binding protein [Pseudomonadota bacterium]